MLFPIINRLFPIYYWEHSVVGGFLFSYFCIKEIKTIQETKNNTIMKARKQLLLMVIALISMAMQASAIGLEDIRINARFFH